MIEYFHMQDIQVVFYLDDGLIIHQSQVVLKHHTDQVCKLVTKSVRLNYISKKSRQNPSQDFVYFGVGWGRGDSKQS